MDELEMYKAQVRLIIARVKKAQAHSQYQSSALRMLEEIGVDLFPSTKNIQSDEQFKQVVEAWLEALPTRVSTLLSESQNSLS